MRKGKLVFPTFAAQKARESLGGSNPIVERTSELAAQSFTPMLASRIYASPALVSSDVNLDARYGAKADTVENIYHPAQPDAALQPRSGFAQALNWLLKGKME